MGRVRGSLEACGDRRRAAWFAEADVVAFDRAVEETATARELYDAMRAFYPDLVNPGALWSSARAAKP